MKKLMKNISIILLIVLLLATYMFPICTYADGPATIKYLALGDSIAYGYGLDNRESDSYASKVKQNYEVDDSNYSNLAISGMTCEEFSTKIKETNYTNAIKAANLITISIGSNELLKIVKTALSSVTGISSDDPDLMQKAKDKFQNASMIEQVTMAQGLYNFITSEESVQELEQGVNTYSVKWAESISYIRQQNSSAIVVATEFYNPYYEVSLGQYDFGGFVDSYIVRMNEILTQTSQSESVYKIAKIYSDFNTTDPRLTNVDIATFNVDPHPNKAGHDLISKKVIAVIPNNPDPSPDPTPTKKDISELEISDIQDQTYTGQEIKPKVVIKDGSKTLVENTDYTLTYSNNTEVGRATVIINGIGNYEGRTEKTFNIKNSANRKSLDNVTVSNVADQTYTGIQITPAVTIKDDTYTLNDKVDYELKYSNNINVGNATITITGIGNYEGTKTVTFKINPKDIKNITVQSIPDQVYTGNKIEPELQLKDESIELEKDKDYELTYKNNTNVGEAEIEIKGKGNYTGTKTIKFNIIEKKAEEDKKDIKTLNIGEIGKKTFTGKLITPEIEIKDNDKILEKNKDYELTYSDNLNVGTGKIIITGKGLYTGTVEKSFEIIQKDVKNTTIKDIKDQEYTGGKIEPEVVISNDGVILKENTDYKVEYVDNVNVGKATIKITGIGNYTGTMTKTFNIVSTETTQKEEIKTIDQDRTLADKILPNTGKKIATSLLIIFTITGIICYIKIKKYKKLKI